LAGQRVWTRRDEAMGDGSREEARNARSVVGNPPGLGARQRASSGCVGGTCCEHGRSGVRVHGASPHETMAR